MRRALLTALALAGVGCALVVTASSTMRQAGEAGMSGLVPGALVGLLEVVNVAGTWTWITDPRARVRLEAALGVVAASSVTAVCGAMTYGPLGLVAPLGLLAAVHLVSRMWSVSTEVSDGTVGVVELVSPPGAPGGREAPTPTLGHGSAPAVEATEQAAAAEPVRLEQQHARRRPSVVATSTAEGRAAPTVDRAA